MGAAYSILGQTKVLYATSLVLLVAKAQFLRRKPSVLVALEEISETCWPQSMLSLTVIPRYSTLENLCTRKVQSSRGGCSRRVRKKVYLVV